jgi:hypothetical protein
VGTLFHFGIPAKGLGLPPTPRESMTITILNNEDHRSTKVDTRASADYGDLVNRAVALSSEFNDLHKEFPLLVHRGAEGDYTAHAILGLDRDENLFVEGDRWITTTMPASMARGPFSLGYVRREESDARPPDMKVMIDEQHPRLRAEGLPVFLPLGGDSAYLEGVKRVLQLVDAGLAFDRVLYPELLAMGLLEEVNIQVAVNSELKYDFNGYYTVGVEKLGEMGGDQLQRLNRLGLLPPIYSLISSLGNFQKLINLKIARLQAA